MASFPLNPVTEQQLQMFAQHPAQSVLIAGPSGSGTGQIAEALIKGVLELSADQDLATYPYILEVKPVAHKALGIDAIRQLEQFLSLKVPVNTAFNRAVFVEDSHLMTNEAQNAFLKTLEEPPAQTILVLTATSARTLLPTVQSRLQVIATKPPARKQLVDYFLAAGNEQKKIDQAYNMSGGLPELMQAILLDEAHPLEQATEIARKLAGGQTYDRLLLVDELAKQKQLAIDVTFILQQMARVSLQQASGSLSQRWQTILKASYEANEALQTNAQAKLVLTNMMLQL